MKIIMNGVQKTLNKVKLDTPVHLWKLPTKSDKKESSFIPEDEVSEILNEVNKVAMDDTVNKGTSTATEQNVDITDMNLF